MKSEGKILFGIAGVITASITGWFVNTQSPDSLGIISVFLLLVGLFFFLLGKILFASTTRAILCAIFVVTILVLRMIGLKHGIYILLCGISIYSIDHLLRDKKPTKPD